jgi:hypothetical protein
MVFENKVLRRIFRQKEENVAGDWRRLNNKELHNLYVSPYIIRVIKSWKMRWMARGTRGRVEKSTRRRRRLVDNIKMELT